MGILDREFCQVCGAEKTDKSVGGHNDEHTGVRTWWCSSWCLNKPSCIDAKTQLLLIRGLPGTGKSTMAKSVVLRGYFDIHFEADMFHMERGKYNYYPARATAAHHWCLEAARVMLHNDKRVVVANTFVTIDSLAPFMRLGFNVAVAEAKGAYTSTHNVPSEVVEQMRSRWEELP